MTARRVIPSQQLRVLKCDDAAVQSFINSVLRKFVAENYQQHLRAVLLDDDNTLTAQLTLQSATQPRLLFEELDAAADEKLWVITTSGGDFFIGTRTDADGSGATALTITRTGTTVDLMTLAAAAIALSGAKTSVVSTTQPRLLFEEQDAAADEKLWVITTSGGDLFVGARTDADAGGGTAVTITRTGTVIDAITLAATRITFDGVARLKGFTVATLPAGTIGDTAYVTDALAPVFGAAVAGGGAVMVPVYYTGAAWFVG